MIHAIAGPELQEECRGLGGCKPGEAKITKGYNLPAKHVIHTVGPVYGREDGKEADILTQCYKNSLTVAHDNNLRSIAFPCIATGCFHYPKEEACKIAIETIRKYVAEYPDAFDEITFVCFSDLDYQIYQSVFDTGEFQLKGIADELSALL